MVIIVEHLEFIRYGLAGQHSTRPAERLDIAVAAYWEQGVKDMQDICFISYPSYGGFYFNHLTLRRSTVPKTKKAVSFVLKTIDTAVDLLLILF